MQRRREQPRAERQQTPKELLGNCLAFIQRKYYQERPEKFYEDRQRILDWVVLWPATWLNNKEVTVPAGRYYQIFTSVFSDALLKGTNIGNIDYLPAYLAKVIHSHFDHHGEEIYNEAKSMRNLVEHAALSLGQLPTRADDPIRELAAARRLLKSDQKARRAAKQAAQKTPVNGQLTLL